MTQRTAALLAAAIAVPIAFLVVSDDVAPIPLISIPQKISAHNSSHGRVYVLREGEVFYAFRAKTRRGFDLQWCPYEEVFWSPETLAVWNRYGTVARAGDDATDGMLRWGTSVDDETLTLEIGPGRPLATVGRAPVPKKVLEFYDRWLNRANLPTDRPLVWCPEPLK